ncbi:MAG: D-Ala-D-Ala carboxypeptidase family metallohydrolase [Bacteroidales bacterium]
MGDITTNFSYKEFTKSNTATAKGIDNRATDEIKGRIKKLTIKILQPLRDYMDVSCTINSGFRCKELNTVLKGATNSRHMKGTAADITFGTLELNKKAYTWIKDNCVYRQLIWEKGDDSGPSWIHVEYDEFDNKCQVLRIK